MQISFPGSCSTGFEITRFHFQIGFTVRFHFLFQAFSECSFQALGSDGCTLPRVGPGSHRLLARPAAGFSVSMRQQYVGWAEQNDTDLLTILKKTDDTEKYTDFIKAE